MEMGGGGDVSEILSMVGVWICSGTTHAIDKKIIISSAYCRMNGSSAVTFNVSLYTRTRDYQPTPPPPPTLAFAALNVSKNK